LDLAWVKSLREPRLQWSIIGGLLSFIVLAFPAYAALYGLNPYDGSTGRGKETFEVMFVASFATHVFASWAASMLVARLVGARVGQTALIMALALLPLGVLTLAFLDFINECSIGVAFPFGRSECR